jgi:hypothetical protein
MSVVVRSVPQPDANSTLASASRKPPAAVTDPAIRKAPAGATRICAVALTVRYLALTDPVSDVVPPIVIDSGLGEPESGTGVGETGLECLLQLARVKRTPISGMITTTRERQTVLAMTTSATLWDQGRNSKTTPFP